MSNFRIIPRLDLLEDRNVPSVTGAVAGGLDAAYGAALAFARDAGASHSVVDDRSFTIDTAGTALDDLGLHASSSLATHADAAANAMAHLAAGVNATANAGVSAAASLLDGDLDYSVDVIRDASVDVSRDATAAANAIANVFASSDTHVSSAELGATGFSFARGFGTGNLGVTV